MKGIELRVARIRRGLRQVDVAERAGITQATVSRIERGLLSPTRRTLQSIKQAIEKPILRKS